MSFDLVVGSDKLVLGCFFESKLESFATVIPNHPKLSQTIPDRREGMVKRILDRLLRLRSLCDDIC